MSLAIAHCRAPGLAAPPVIVEVHVSGGLPGMSIVGLPETTVRESRDRVRSALLHSQFKFPQQRITVNLAPADLPKEGSRFDLAIAMGILAATGQIPADALASCELIAELGLGGELRPVRGVLAAALRRHGTERALIVARDNANEAALAGDSRVHGAAHLLEVCAHLCGHTLLDRVLAQPAGTCTPIAPDLADVRGQWHAKRALEIAAAGGHSLLFIGPPGTGKSMLAERLPGILPPLCEAEALEAAAVRSVAGLALDPARWRLPPFRQPHHSASAVALVGGGNPPRPGEISLAHHGVLFLDELPEFDRRALEALREPIESGTITITRAARRAEFPARVQLIGAMNPCPCGYLGDPSGRCACTTEQIVRYHARLSGPLLDRIDLHVEVPRLPWVQLHAEECGETSATVRARVVAARARQYTRGNRLNRLLDGAALDARIAPHGEGHRLLGAAVEKLGLSARAVQRVRRLACTIADLDGTETVTATHIGEAIGYRVLDRRG